MSHKIGWVGTGRMGYPMASRLAKAGYDVNVWNRTKAKQILYLNMELL